MTQQRKRHIKQIIMLTANAMIALATLVAAYGGMVNPNQAVIPSMAVLTFPIWLLMCLAILVVDLIFYARAAFIPVATLLCSAGPILAYSPLNIGTPTVSEEQEKTAFTILSYNVYGFGNSIRTDTTYHDTKYYRERMEEGVRNPQISYILSKRADITCLQEGWNVKSESLTRYIAKDQCDSLEALYPVRINDDECIYTMHPAKLIKLRQPEGPWASFTGAEIDIHGHTILVINVHLQSVGLQRHERELYENLTHGEATQDFDVIRQHLLSKLGTALRYRAVQAHLLREQIDSLNYENVIVCGDFNDVPDSYAARVIAGDDFHSAFAERASGPMITYHTDRFYFNIDHILYRGKMKPISFARGKIPNSDHYPIEARFVWDD